jgi:hypothetical protein
MGYEITKRKDWNPTSYIHRLKLLRVSPEV